MQVKSIAECSKGSILQYFQPSLSYNLSLRSLFCLFLSSRYTQVLLYVQVSCPLGDMGWSVIYFLLIFTFSFIVKARCVLIRDTNRGSYMSAHVILNLFNELGKRDQMIGLPGV